MFIRIGNDIIDTDLLDIQGLQWRLRNEQLQTKFTSRQAITGLKQVLEILMKRLTMTPTSLK